MLKQFLEAGKITATHGIRGEVRIQPQTNSPEFLCGFKTLYIDSVPIKVVSSTVHKSGVITQFEGINGIDSAVRLKNKTVYIDRNEAILEPGEHFLSDLIGLKAIEADSGNELGKITEIIPLNPNNVYVITGNREILVPAVKEFVKEINVEEGYVSFRLIEGM
jgi:16S rRNA processing protein RimM